MTKTARLGTKKDGGRRDFFLYPLDKQQVGQAKPQWAQGMTIVQCNVETADDSGKTARPIVGFRVEAAGYPAAPPTDPDVNNSLIRFLGSTPSYQSRNQTGDTPVGA